MRTSKARMAVAAMFSVAVLAAAAMLATSGYPPFSRTAVASQVVAAIPAGAIRVNGSQPLVPTPALRLSGEVTGLLPESTGLVVTIKVGDQAYAATVQGNAYAVNLGHPSPEAMVILEARAPGIHFRSVAGSVGRLRMLAGGDSLAMLAEHSSLRISPYSTALAWMVQFVLGGRDATSDIEFGEATRSAVNSDLELAAYTLSAVVTNEWELPAPFENGYQLLQDKAAFRQFIAQREFAERASGYLFRQADHSPLTALEQVPARMVMLDGVPYGEIAMQANDVLLLSKLADGSYDLYEDEPFVNPNYSVRLTGGDLILYPTGVVQRYYEKPYSGDIALKEVEEQVLRRLTAGAGVDVWVVQTTWYRHDTSGSNLQIDYRVFSAANLDAWARPDGWPGMSARPLPWFCETRTPVSGIAQLSDCGYVQHQLRTYPVGYGQTVRHGWNVDPNSLLPQPSTDAQRFDWSMDAQGVLRVTSNGADTRFWRTRGRYQSVGSVIYMTRSLTGASAGQVMVGLSMTSANVFTTLSSEEVLGEWAQEQATISRPRYTVSPSSYRIRRDAGGTGSIEWATDGQGNGNFSMFWEIHEAAVYDIRAIGRFANGPNQYFRSCDQALAAGATLCWVQINYFRPVLMISGRYYGIWESYQAPLIITSSGASVGPLTRLSSVPGLFACTGGACLTRFTAAASAPGISPVVADPAAMPARGVENRRTAPKTRAGKVRTLRLMPIYAFECTQCGHSFDRLQKLSDPDPDTCPECNTISVKRQVTAPAFRLAGSGWYETDFKKDGDKKRNLADGGEGAAKSAGDSKPAEAAPAAKSETKAEAKPASAPSTPAA